MKQRVPLHVEIKAQVWASPGPEMSLTELVEKMHALGNPVLKIDEEHNRILVAYLEGE